MSQLPIIRKKPEGGQDNLLSLTISHPDGGNPPQIDLRWDGEWVKANGLPPVFSQQVLGGALQALFAAALVICSNVVPPPTATPEQN